MGNWAAGLHVLGGYLCAVRSSVIAGAKHVLLGHAIPQSRSPALPSPL